jgi:hypothetical protein
MDGTRRTAGGPYGPVEIAMGRPMIAILYLMTMIVVIVTVDVVIFANHFWERLMVNIGIVLVFAAFYLRFLKHS